MRAFPDLHACTALLSFAVSFKALVQIECMMPTMPTLRTCNKVEKHRCCEVADKLPQVIHLGRSLDMVTILIVLNLRIELQFTIHYTYLSAHQYRKNQLANEHNRQPVHSKKPSDVKSVCC